MAPDSVGAWWHEDTKRRFDNLTTQLCEVAEAKKLIWHFCPPDNMKALSVMHYKAVCSHLSAT